MCFDSDRSPEFTVSKDKGQEDMDCERCCWFCFVWQVCLGNWTCLSHMI